MLQTAPWKNWLVILATVFAIAFSLPNVLPQKTLDSLPGWVPAQRLNLGLDLQGGSYLLLEVDTASLAREKLNDLMEDARSALNKEGVEISELAQVNGAITMRVKDAGQVDKAYSTLQKLSQPSQTGGRDIVVSRQADQRLSLARTTEAQRAESSLAVTRSIEIVRRRIDKLGTREPLISQQGANRIVVQAAGESDPERLKNIIGKTAKLTFQMVDQSVSVQEAQAGRVPPGSILLPSEENPDQFFLVKKKVLVTGEMLTRAYPENDQQSGRPVVAFGFNGVGSARFADATRANVGKPFAIILDDKVISAPTIISPITGGSGIITGNYTIESASDFALLLNAGALPTTLNTLEQRQVGAELGADAVKAGQVSTLVGFVAIVIFVMLAYGAVFGGISVVGLVLNLLLIVAFLSVTQSTLTLPGIAGVILTLAVAVDANVLIYERIRDEERGGAKPMMALDTGFKRASVSIYDANVTTMISALIMYFAGSGPVKGFAFNLMVGVVTSLFTAMFVGQVLIWAWFRATKPKQLPI
ncbi:protein translocase subunit SecD [soil metagenome]